MITLIIRLLVVFGIFTLMRSYSDSFTCGFWASVVVDLFMHMTRTPAPVVEEKK